MPTHLKCDCPVLSLKIQALDSKIFQSQFNLEKDNLDNFGRFCPVCKNKNERDAIVCRYCGASLDEYPTSAAVTTRNTGSFNNLPAKLGESTVETSIPDNGIAIYIAGTPQPVFICSDKEFVIGRKMGEDTSESILDLSEFGGFNMGISRRHATIQRTETGYKIIDLSSTNGTWLNDERLIPNKPYPLASEAELRVGRMRFLVRYRSIPDPEKKG